MLHRTLSLVLLLLISQFALAQYNNPRGRANTSLLDFSVGGKAGMTLYFGDLMASDRACWNVGALAEKNASSWIAVRLGIDGGQVKGANDYQRQFKTTFVDVNLFCKFYPLDLIQGYEDGRLFNPYFGLGGGGLYFSAKKEPTSDMTEEEIAEISAKSVLHQEFLYSEKSGLTGEVGGFIGVRYSFSTKLYIFFEATGLMLFTDDFDAYTGYPISDKDSESGYSWKESDSQNDCMWTITIGAQYRFYDFSKYSYSSKYSRKSYLRNRVTYERNARRMRRR